MESKPRILITREQIAGRIEELADLIRLDYDVNNPLLICVLKGAFVFTAALVKCLRL